MNDIGLKKGIAINFVAKYSNILLQLIITSILARLLTPKEYGVISVVTIFITFFNLLGDMGIGPAIIQYKELEEEDISSIFIFTFFSAIFLVAMFFGFSYLIAYMYGNAIYVPIGHLLCFSILFNLLCIVPNGVLLRDKQFKIVGVSSIISNTIAGVITIILAYEGFSYYALVFNSIIQAGLNFIMLFRFSGIKINIRKYSTKPIRKIGSFSIYQFLFNFINYFSRNSDNLLIGKFLGTSPLGYYDKAYKLMLYPIQSLTFVITPVLQPVLSDYRNEKEVILTYYKKIAKVLGLLGIFVSVFCFFSAREIILIMYGSRWTASIFSFKILALTIVFQMVSASSGSIFQATGHTKYLFISGLISALTMVVLICSGVFGGKTIEYVSIFLVLGFVVNFFQGYYILMRKVFNDSLFSFLKEFKTTVIIMIIMVAAYLLIRINIENYLISFAVKLIIGTAAYLLGLFITKEFNFVKGILVKKK